MWTKNDDGKIPYFSRRAEELAKQVQANEIVRRTNTTEGGTSESTARRGRNRKYRGRGGRDNRNNDRNEAGGRKRRHSANSPWTRKCLNKDKCDGVHRIEDCPITSEQDKKRLLKEHIEKLKGIQGSNDDQAGKRQRRSGRSLISEGTDYNIDVVIGGVETKARDDTGADMTVIPMKLLTRILHHDKKVVVKEMIQPIEIVLAVKGDDVPKVVIDRETRANIEIKLPGSGLPVILRIVRMLVTMHEMEVVLLGRDLLDRLGFNFKNHITER